MKQTVRALAVLGLLASSHAFATHEFRSPWISERGPLVYTEFDKLREDKWNFNMWSTAHLKDAHKAYIKHGTDSEPLTKLFFNSDSFKLKDALPNRGVGSFDRENYSPLWSTVRVKPRAHYKEYGMTMGARFDYPVWEGKGRVGLRGTLPMRCIEIERQDTLDVNADPLSDVVRKRCIRVNRTGFNSAVKNAEQVVDSETFKTVEDKLAAGVENVSKLVSALTKPTAAAVVAKVVKDARDGAADGDNISTKYATRSQGLADLQTSVFNKALGAESNSSSHGTVNGTAYRADFVKALRGLDFSGCSYNAFVQATNATDIAAPSKDAEFRLGGHDIAVPNAQTVDVATGTFELADRRAACIGLTRSTGCVNSPHYAGYQYFNKTTDRDDTLSTSRVKAWVEDKDIVTFAGSSNVKDNQIVVFDNNTNLKDMWDKLTDCDLENLWFTFRHDVDSTDNDKRSDVNGANCTAVQRALDNNVRKYEDFDFRPLRFMAGNGFEFETSKRTGVGDLDIDLFYEHRFNDCWMGELFFGVRFPTASGGTKWGNPYRPRLGNGDHWEVKLGGTAAWDACKYFMFKMDLYYSWVLEDSEHRAATFKGACVKNVGPCVQADVDWGYFVGRFDFNFTHPKTDKIMSMIGYEIYYKTRDKICYKNNKVQSWLGRKLNDKGVFVEQLDELDPCLARKNTESVGHKVRGEWMYRLSKYCEIFAGGTWTFAGQNIARDKDCHGGVNVRF
ncbi:MAG: hypothetical protein H6679_01890 [Epsilonproteobacteria bacterium]|nr:hypothetical protein [Campylobacterota bacterium]